MRVVAALSLAGCVGAPYVAPPLEVGIGGTGRASSSRNGSDGALSVRVAATPMGFGEGWLGRKFDFGIGYINETGTVRTIEGAFAEGGLAIVRGQVGARSWGRVLARGQWRVLKASDDPRFGMGGAISLTGELVTYTEGPFAAVGKDGGVVGYAFGETGLGLFFEGGYARFPSFDVFQVTGGLQIRLPASAGFVWAWAWKLK